MPTVLDVGTTSVPVRMGEFWGHGIVRLRDNFPDSYQVLLTSRIPICVDNPTHDGRGLTFCAFRGVTPPGVTPGFYIEVCELDRRPVSQNVSIEVDWAIVVP
jgi:hypothetical protein